jgi:dephospho-CoA kinase
MQPCSPAGASPPRPILVGLVGRIGAGKSTVARLLASLGARRIDADRIAHEVLADGAVAREVAARLGPEALAVDGSVDRGSVARMVFGDSSSHRRRLESLEAIVHPRVRERIAEMIDAASAEAAGGEAPVLVLDIPLLVHGGWSEACDWIVRVTCDEETRLARLSARGWSQAEIRARDAAWEARNAVDPARFGAVCLATVDASRDESYTAEAVNGVWRQVAASGRSSPSPP